MSESSLPLYSIVAHVCLRCGACSTMAPGLIAMGETAAIVVRQPADREEVAAADAALFNCPVFAIRKKTSGS